MRAPKNQYLTGYPMQNKLILTLLAAAFAATAPSCAPLYPYAVNSGLVTQDGRAPLFADRYGNVPIDLVPLYGGLDRFAQPVLAAADRKLIEKVENEFGSRRSGSLAFMQAGLDGYRQDEYAESMRRYNQAWLLDPENPDVYLGFALIYHDHLWASEAAHWVEIALEHGLDGAEQCVEAAHLLTRMNTNAPSLTYDEREHRLNRVLELIARADALKDEEDRDYVDELAARTLITCKEFDSAAARLEELDRRGVSPDPSLRADLEKARESSRP